MRSRTTVLAAAAALLTLSLHAQTIRKRALLIGINDYTAAAFTAPKSAPPADRDWANLGGTINDLELMRDLIEKLYGFAPADVTALKNHEATRDAILAGLARLAATAKKDDVILFYYSGHGSQVRNSLSSETDKLDESLVPADSRHGARDIRDKELRDAFNRIIDRGARLTVVLDACHSGSGARGLDGGLGARVVQADGRDAADRSTGPRPEDRGALILSAAQDFDQAFETLDENDVIRGAFTWALARALRDAEPGEPVNETFLRAQARLRAERPGQDPVISGSEEVRLRPFLDVRTHRGTNRSRRRPVIAIDGIAENGNYILQGGWAHGVTVGSELRVAGNEDVRLQVKSLHGVARAEAQLIRMQSRAAPRLAAGALLEIAAWAPPPSRPLRVWIPRAGDGALAFARQLRDAAAQRSIRWIDDPTENTPTHLIRWRDRQWELVVDGRAKQTPTPLDDAGPGASLFVQLPVSARLADAIGKVDGVELTSGPETADYILAGRLTTKGIEYAFVRPGVSSSDSSGIPLPVRTAWKSEDAAFTLQDSLTRLRRVHGWHDLQSPYGAVSYYDLAIRRADDGVIVTDGVLHGERPHQLLLRANGTSPVYTRYMYAFVIDSAGTSVLLFPRLIQGSVENRLPLTATAARPVPNPPAEIVLDASEPFTVAAPYGVDTYFLLSTDEPLPSLSTLQWAGVRGGNKRGVEVDAPPPKNPLERLLTRMLSGSRGDDSGEPLRTPPNWSLQKVTFQSVPPRRTKP